jgi:hypothetical protein
MSTVFAVSYQPQIIQPTKPYQVIKNQSSAQNTYYTLLNTVSGSGSLNAIRIAGPSDLDNSNFQIRITADGTEYTISNGGSSSMATGFYQYNGADYANQNALVFYGPLYFKTSLKIEFVNTNASTKTLQTMATYALE